MRNIFLEMLRTFGRETTPRPFSKTSKLMISLDSKVCFNCMPNQGLTKYIKTKQ